MRNVKRFAIPTSLAENATNWTDDLLTAIDNYRNTGEKIPDRVKNKYKQADVLKTLKLMYNDGYGTCFCCYCESSIEDVGYPHIEHRKPKDKDLFPEEAFSWDNLHLACEKCNKNKLNKWDADNEILDATRIRIRIENHLGYKVKFPEGIYVETLTERGVTTEKHTDLNRKSLRTARLKIFSSINDSIKEIRSSSDDPRTHTAKQILADKCTGIHGSLIAWALKNEDVLTPFINSTI